MGASLSAATVQPVVRLYMQSLGPVANVSTLFKLRKLLVNRRRFAKLNIKQPGVIAVIGRLLLVITPDR